MKRFGRVGGMESYVWHLVHGLADQGILVVVVCERLCEQPRSDIRIIKVEMSPTRPRWVSMMTFRTRVDQKIREVFHSQPVLIHSHERSLCHSITTFHGPPIQPPKFFERFSRFNRRFIAWQQMEEDELLGSNVQMILPVSSWVLEQLDSRYPEIMNKKIELAWPGVTPSATIPRIIPRSMSKCAFVFVGKEWKRKGLKLAVCVVEEFRKLYPKATLTVFGVDRTTAPSYMRALDWINFIGWSSSIPWPDFDVLIHPALKEPFGMVVAEARSHGVPVIMSSQVGAVDLSFSATKILQLNAPLNDWCRAAEEVMTTNTGEPEVKWIWSQLVRKHVEIIYPQIEELIL